MSLILALAAASTASVADARFAECTTLIRTDPSKAIDFASRWQTENGGVPARECLGLAFAAAGRWVAAMTAFEQAARLAEREQNPRATLLWVQAGNAALAGGQAGKARVAFENGLSSGRLTGVEAGEVWIDYGRTLVALGDMPNARKAFDQALKLAPLNPLGWLFSATLARRMSDPKRAETDIAEATRLAPNDAAVALEAGNIALLLGVPDAAKLAWEAAARLDPDGPIGASARAALEQFR